jgi:hypothetical protein
MDYLDFTDEFLDAHQIEFKESVSLFKFEEEDENEDLEKLFGAEKKFNLNFGF